MSAPRPYLLTPTARRHLREARAWSLARWGQEMTRKYFEDLDAAASTLADNPTRYTSREELSGSTGLLLHPVREHFFVYEFLKDGRLVIVAVIRQGRDVSSILRRGAYVIRRELDQLRETKDG